MSTTDHVPTMEEAAIAAAHAAPEAVTELLRLAREAVTELRRFAHEGACSDSIPFAYEPVRKLADALRLEMDIEGEPSTDSLLFDAEENAQRRALVAALDAFLEGWVG